LQRVAAASPLIRASTAAIRQFICCSATIANPGELASRLLEKEVEVLNSNARPLPKRLSFFYNPPVVNRALAFGAATSMNPRAWLRNF